jgi:hypothetical protein
MSNPIRNGATSLSSLLNLRAIVRARTLAATSDSVNLKAGAIH